MLCPHHFNPLENDNLLWVLLWIQCFQRSSLILTQVSQVHIFPCINMAVFIDSCGVVILAMNDWTVSLGSVILLVNRLNGIDATLRLYNWSTI